jgi:hypothetical protein
MVYTQHFVASYLAAQRQHREAERVMARAERMLDRMIEHGVDEDRAYKLAGVALADARSVRAYQDMRQAREALALSVRNQGTVARLLARGAMVCADRPRGANENAI